tara:strand:- start:638 stop:1003 length:366 start_codon:yes stop_codon:yes gene_type:complete
MNSLNLKDLYSQFSDKIDELATEAETDYTMDEKIRIKMKYETEGDLLQNIDYGLPCKFTSLMPDLDKLYVLYQKKSFGKTKISNKMLSKCEQQIEAYFENVPDFEDLTREHKDIIDLIEYE